MPSAAVTVAFSAIVAIGAATHAVTGFGFSLVVVPVTAALVGPKAGIALATAMGVITPTGMAVSGRALIDRAPVARILIAAIAGAPLGLIALSRLSPTTLRVLIAVAVAASVGFLWRRPRLARVGNSVDVAAGVVSGALAASVGTNGPPVVLALQTREIDPDPFRATSSACFAAINSSVFVVFVVTGHVDWAVMTLALWSLPLLGVGWWFGTSIHDRIPQDRFRHVVLGLLLASAVSSALLAVA